MNKTPRIDFTRVLEAANTLQLKRDFKAALEETFAWSRNQAKPEHRVYLWGSLGEGNRQITTPVPKISQSDY